MKVGPVQSSEASVQRYSNRFQTEACQDICMISSLLSKHKQQPAVIERLLTAVKRIDPSLLATGFLLRVARLIQ